MDRKTKELIAIYGGLHPKSCVDGLYIPKNGERGLVSVEDCVEDEKCSLEKYATQWGDPSQDYSSWTQPGKVRCQCEQQRKETDWKSGKKKRYTDNLWWKQNATMKVRSGSGWGKESWKGRLKVSLVLSKNKLSELIQWSIVLTRPVKLRFAGLATKTLKVSHTSLVPALIWERTNTEKGMIK